MESRVWNKKIRLTKYTAVRKGSKDQLQQIVNLRFFFVCFPLREPELIFPVLVCKTFGISPDCIGLVDPYDVTNYDRHDLKELGVSVDGRNNIKQWIHYIHALHWNNSIIVHEFKYLFIILL